MCCLQLLRRRVSATLSGTPVMSKRIRDSGHSILVYRKISMNSAMRLALSAHVQVPIRAEIS